MSYFLLLVVAGNETTRNATSGGLHAFIENPDQWRMLKQDPLLLRSAVEEIVRWVTPVIQFARTASQDYELRGRKIHKGDSLCLFYPSANRDEEVFQEPFKFDIGVTRIRTWPSESVNISASVRILPGLSSRLSSASC